MRTSLNPSRKLRSDSNNSFVHGGPRIQALQAIGQMLLRYALSAPGVSVAIPGARHPDRIARNVATVEAFTPMPEEAMYALELAASRFD